MFYDFVKITAKKIAPGDFSLDAIFLIRRLFDTIREFFKKLEHLVSQIIQTPGEKVLAIHRNESVPF